jgi:GT2 family glycosyltransferase
MPEISIVLPAYNEGVRLRQTIEALRDTVKVNYQVIVVNDSSRDSCCEGLDFGNLVLVNLPKRQGVAHARNLGAEQATAPVLIAMDAHCVPQAGWLEKMLAELPEAGIVAPQIRSMASPSANTFGLTIRDRELGVEWLQRRGDQPYAVPLAGCACLMMRREFFEAIGRFDAMRCYGMEDVEICLRCWLLGYSVRMVPEAVVGHWFKKEPFQAGWHDYLYNRLRTAVLHFDGAPLQRILTTLQTKPQFGDAVASLLLSDIWARRELVRARRKRDADWFCREFSIVL